MIIHVIAYILILKFSRYRFIKEILQIMFLYSILTQFQILFPFLLVILSPFFIASSNDSILGRKYAEKSFLFTAGYFPPKEYNKQVYWPLVF